MHGYFAWRSCWHLRQLLCQVITKFEIKAYFIISERVENFSRYRRTTHVTPKSYLSFLNGYKSIYAQKHGEIDNLANRMSIGLEKLVEAGESVVELKKELAEKELELAVANEKADKVLKEVAKKKEAAEKIKQQVQKVKDKAQSIVDEIEKDKAIAEQKLEAAKPALLVKYYFKHLISTYCIYVTTIFH